MKVSAKFLLAGVLVLLSATAVLPVSAQTWSQFTALEGRVFELEMKLRDRQEDIQNLAKKQDALKEALDNAKFDIEFLKSMRGFADTKTDETSKKLNETEKRLATAEGTIDLLNLRLSALEATACKPKVPASKPKPAVQH